MKKYLALLIVFLVGCAQPVTTTWITYVPNAPVVRHDHQHTVGPAESLWQISKIYDVESWDIAKANNLPIPAELKAGQILTIPNAAPYRPIVPLYPSAKWKYIIIHHSATENGDALEIDYSHLQRGFNGIGYDFLIDNGSEGKYDGQIEVTPRWLKQLDGAHCKADGMNYKGIGVCLVGNFDEDKVSHAQAEALVYLVKHLMQYYHIPKENVIGHGQVKGAATDCPGKKFPWKTFWKMMRD